MSEEGLRGKIEEILGSRRSWIDSQQSMVSKRDIADAYDKCIGQLISLFSEVVEESLERLLQNGHGGGNWRRLIEMERQKLKEILKD